MVRYASQKSRKLPEHGGTLFFGFLWALVIETSMPAGHVNHVASSVVKVPSLTIMSVDTVPPMPHAPPPPTHTDTSTFASDTPLLTQLSNEPKKCRRKTRKKMRLLLDVPSSDVHILDDGRNGTQLVVSILNL